MTGPFLCRQVLKARATENNSPKISRAIMRTNLRHKFSSVCMRTFFMLLNNSFSLVFSFFLVPSDVKRARHATTTTTVGKKTRAGERKFFIHCSCWTRNIHSQFPVEGTGEARRLHEVKDAKYFAVETLWKINVKSLWLRTNYEK